MKKFLFSLFLVLSLYSTPAVPQHAGDGKQSNKIYTVATLPTCSETANNGQSVSVSDGNKGSRTCRNTTGSTYSWVNDDPVFNILRFGSTATATTTLVAIHAAIAAASAGETVLVPDGSYSINDVITINKGIRFVINGTITQTVAAKNGIAITASNVIVEGKGSLIGVQAASFNANEKAVNINEGGTAGVYLTGVVVQDITISTWGGYGILARYIGDNSRISRVKVNDAYYAGIGLVSAKKARVEFCDVVDIEGSVTGNAYGIFVSHYTSPAEARSEDVLVTNNYVRNVPVWEGLDTHGGKNITFANNQVLATYLGIAVGVSTDGSNPENCVVVSNIVNSELTTGAASYGITFSGTSAASPGTGTVFGNTVKGFGTQSSITIGAIDISATSGLVVSGNSIYEPGGVGINIRGESFGFNVTGNTITDVWSTAVSNPIAIRVNSGNSLGAITLNNFARGSKSATYVNVEGLRIDNTAGNSIYYLPGYIDSAVTTKLVDAGVFSKSGFASYDKANDRYGFGVAAPTKFIDAQSATTDFNFLMRNSGSGSNGFNIQVDSSQDVYLTQAATRAVYFTVAGIGTLYLNSDGTVSPQRTLKLANVAVTATSGGTTTLDLKMGNIRTVTMPSGNTTITASNVPVGTVIINIIQDAIGSRTVAWNSLFKWSAATAPTLTTTASARDIFTFSCDGTDCYNTDSKLDVR